MAIAEQPDRQGVREHINQAAYTRNGIVSEMAILRQHPAGVSLPFADEPKAEGDAHLASDRLQSRNALP
jgi:hypothetical protein